MSSQKVKGEEALITTDHDNEGFAARHALTQAHTHTLTVLSH